MEVLQTSPLGLLGTAPKNKEYSETAIHLSVAHLTNGFAKPYCNRLILHGEISQEMRDNGRHPLSSRKTICEMRRLNATTRGRLALHE